MNQTLTKEQVQQRVLQNGKPLPLDKFTWDEKTRTFSSDVYGLVIDFSGINNCRFETEYDCTFKTGSHCTFNTGSHCTFDTVHSCMFKTENDCTFNTGSYCTFDTESNCIFNTEYNCAFNTKSYCTFKTGWDCTFNTRYDCTFTTGSRCTFNTGNSCKFITGSHCTFNTGYDCTFKTEYDCAFRTEYSCTFNTGSYCTFKTEYDCTFKTGSDCTFNTGLDCIFNIFEYGYFNTTNCGDNVVVIKNSITNKIIKLSNLQNNKLVRLSHNHNPVYRDIQDIKLVDYRTMIINSTKQLDRYKIHSSYYIEDYFHDDTPQKIFIAEQDNLFAHGKSIKEAIADLEFKKLSKLGANEHIQRIIKQGYMNPQDYRLLTRACREGTNRFLEDNDLTWDDIRTIDEVIDLTKGNYGHDIFIRLLEENGYNHNE